MESMEWEANTMTNRSDHQLLDSLAVLFRNLQKPGIFQRCRGSEPSPSKCLSPASSCHSLPLWPGVPTGVPWHVFLGVISSHKGHSFHIKMS